MRRLPSNTMMNADAEAFLPSAQAPTTPGGGKRISIAEATKQEAPKPPPPPPLESSSPSTSAATAAAAAAMAAMSYGYGYGSPQAAYGFGASGMTPEMLQYLYSMSMSPAAMAYHAAAGMHGAAAMGQGLTTVMLRNIPNRYTRDMLIECLDTEYKGQYDFVYLPIDFNSKCNVGYAFINFRIPAMAQKFMQEFHGVRAKQCLPGFSSKKVCEVSYATVQGREANMENFRDEKFIEKLKERPEWHPLFYDNQGKEIPLNKVLGQSNRKRRSSTGDKTPGKPQTAVTSPKVPVA